MRVYVIAGVLLAVGACGTDRPAESAAAGTDSAEPVSSPADSAEIVATVEAFHRALAEGDTSEVRRLLTADVVVLEGGIVEDREEYLGHHLGADMAFAAAVPGHRELLRVEVHDSAAWLATTSRRQGTFRGREIDSQGAELVVLRRTASGWRIASVHWSSR